MPDRVEKGGGAVSLYPSSGEVDGGHICHLKDNDKNRNGIISYLIYVKVSQHLTHGMFANI